MADYNVGNIEVGIKANSSNTISQLDQLINKLQDFKKIDKDLQNTFNSVNKLSNGFNKLSKLKINDLGSKINETSKATKELSGNLSSINKPNFSETSKALNQLTNAMRKLDSIKNLDFRNLYNSISSLNRILEPFLAKLNASKDSLQAMATILNNIRTITLAKANNNLEKINKHTNKIKENVNSTKFSNMFNLGKIYFLFNYSKRMIRFLGGMVSSAIDFNETLNKFQVSMGKNYQTSLKFVEGITKAFNLSTESIMDYMSTFKNMLSALGNLSEDTSYKLSESLTRMALDYASLFNVEVERAMEQFQAVLSGQIRSIRSVSGYDVSETSIFNIYKSLGGTKTMRQLDQVEKRLLRIIALQQQMEATGAVGDFEKTINTTANQLKQIAETFKEIGRWLGQYVMFAIAPLVKYTLSISIALREILEFTNTMKGYKYEDFGGGGLFGAVEEGAENAEEAVDGLKNKLLGFDQINTLGESESQETDYDMLISQIKEYQSGFENVKNDANEISKSILEWLGYTYDAEGNLQKTGKTLDYILNAVKTVFAIFVSQKALKAVTSIVNALKGLSILKTLTPTAGVIGAIVALFAILYTTNEDFRNSINQLITSIMDLLLPIIKVIFKIIEAIMPIVMTIINEIVYILAPIINAISPIISLIGQVVESLLPIISVIADILSGVIVVVLDVILIAFNAIWGVIEIIVQLISGGLQVALGVVIGLVETFKGVFQSIGVILQTFVDAFSALFSGDFEGFISAFDGMGERLKSIWGNVWESIKNTFKNIINGIIKGFATFVNLFTDKVNNLTQTLSGAWTWLGIPAIPEIPRWEPTLLATGGVIREPTNAIMGEYKGAKSNPEIVTPESLMREVFLDSILPVAQAITAGNKQVVDAIGDLAERPVELNGRKVSENIYNDLQNVALRKGKKLAF